MSYEDLPFDASGLEQLEKHDWIGALKSDFKYPAKKYASFISKCFDKVRKKLFNNTSISLDENKNSKITSYSR